MSTVSLQDLLGLRREPIGLAFVEAIPAGLPRVDRSASAGCAYWTLAAEGHIFYTLAEDHYGCPIGAFTHGLDLPTTLANDLQNSVQTMLQLGYLRPDEPSALPRLQRSYQAIIYSPLHLAPVPAEVVIVTGEARSLMLLAEAVQLIGLDAGTISGRPGCGMIAQVLQGQRAVTNLGCIGNRVYTRIADDEFYLAFPGSRLSEIEHALERILEANRQLEQQHRQRCQTPAVLSGMMTERQ